MIFMTFKAYINVQRFLTERLCNVSLLRILMFQSVKMLTNLA